MFPTKITDAVVAVNRSEDVRAEALQRIERWTLEVLAHVVMANCVAGYACPAGAASRTRGEEEEETAASSPHTACFGSESWTRKRGRRACLAPTPLKEMRRIALCLPVLYRHIQCGAVCTQRDVYYHLIRHVPDQRCSDSCIRRVCDVLGLSRRAVNVIAGRRGCIGGCIRRVGGWESAATAADEACSSAPAGSLMHASCFAPPDGHAATHADIPIPGDAQHLTVAPWGTVVPSPVVNPKKGGCGGTTTAPEEGRASSCSSRGSRTALVSSGEERATTPESSDVVASRLLYSPPVFYLSPDIRAVIVVEKYTVYHRLLQEGLTTLFPCVLLTSHGFPTQAARRLLANISLSIRQMDSRWGDWSERPGTGTSRGCVGSMSNGGECCSRPLLLALGDFNPSGVCVIHQYKFGGSLKKLCRSTRCRGRGSRRAGDNGEEDLTAAEMAECRVPDLRWVGLRSHHVLLRSAPSQTVSSSFSPSARTTARYYSLSPYTPFTPRDDALLDGLLEEIRALRDTYRAMRREATRRGGEVEAGTTTPANDDSVAAEKHRRGLVLELAALPFYRPLRDGKERHAFIEGAGAALPSSEWEHQRVHWRALPPTATTNTSNSPQHHRHGYAPDASEVRGVGAASQHTSAAECEEEWEGAGDPHPSAAVPSSAQEGEGLLVAWLLELELMKSARVKVELEALIDLTPAAGYTEGMEMTPHQVQPCLPADSPTADPPHAAGDRSAWLGSSSRTPNRSQPLSRWLYQKILAHDYV